MYLLTLAPGVDFWDAGEFIAAAHGFGIPHPPGTPLYVALGRVCIMAGGWLMGSARVMNALSALGTASAGGLTAWLIARETRATVAGEWGAMSAGLVAGLMCSVWANATETEVYALALLHTVVLLACASRVADGPHSRRWVSLTAYLIALAPAIHLSALVGAPAAIALAARRRDGKWSPRIAITLFGVLVTTAAIGRMSPLLGVAGVAMMLAGLATRRRADDTVSLDVLLLVPLAASALLIMLVRARHDPVMNQGNPNTLRALVDVVARRQYPVAGLLPRQAPLWLQAANVVQYADWQVAMGWGRGIFTTPLRVLATLAYVALGVIGVRSLRTTSARLADALLVLVVCGTAGVAVYLNLKAGASLGWGALPDSIPHEARERDYFFVLGFWGWACFAGWGALSLARRVHRPWLAMAAALVPLAGNWSSVDRSQAPEAAAARQFAVALLENVPRGGVLFTSGDNDSYPLWYLQQVEGARPDVQLVTLPLLPAGWYAQEIGRRTGWKWDDAPSVAGVIWVHEQTAAGIAHAAYVAHRTVTASPALTVRERSLVGSGWTLRGPVFVASGPPSVDLGTPQAPPVVDVEAARRWVAVVPPVPPSSEGLPDDVASIMFTLLQCPRLGLPWVGMPAGRDSLEVKCNFR